MGTAESFELPSLQKLQSVEQLDLLDVVDTLRARGLSDLVALPQLIVCGDQSSGKSSVLEAISGIPFPRQETLCTRFATEVILRRAAMTEIKISIHPGNDRSTLERDELLGFHHELKSTNDFEQLFKSATAAMGLSSGIKSFSNDVLRIEFSGPSQPPLTLVDLPGLIHSAIGQQTSQDVTLVHNLVSTYLESPRSIILAVVSAKSDASNQIILSRAKEVDGHGLRTLGIITKPDTLERGSASEQEYIALASNEKVKFSLGWHVVRNLDMEKEKNQLGMRDTRETLFFKESNFSSLPPHTVGIAFLRTRLSKVLFDQIRTELPKLVEDITTKIVAINLTQSKLGPSRATVDEQRSFLTSLSESFQRICGDAVRGHYEDRFFQVDTDPERRLCACIINKHFEFADNIRKKGSYWKIQDNEAQETERTKVATDECCTGLRQTREEAIQAACTLLKHSRGRELPGLPNPLLVGELFRQYSRPWSRLAQCHIRNVWDTAVKFLELLLKYLTDDDTCEKILKFWLIPIMEEKLKLAYRKLDELLEVHQDYPLTTNIHFIKNSQKPRLDHVKVELERRIKEEIAGSQTVSIQDISRIMSAMESTSSLKMDLMAAEEALDNMNSFYEVALNLFTDNVPTLAIQAPIIKGLSKEFAPTAVFSMDLDIIKKIAGEDEGKTLEREALARRLEILQNGARICKQYEKRPQTSLIFRSKEVPESEVVPESKVKTHSRSTKVPASGKRAPPNPPESLFSSKSYSLFNLSSSSSGSTGKISGDSATAQPPRPFSFLADCKPPAGAGLAKMTPDTSTGSLAADNNRATSSSHFASGGLFGSSLPSSASATNASGATPSSFSSTGLFGSNSKSATSLPDNATGATSSNLFAGLSRSSLPSTGLATNASGTIPNNEFGSSGLFGSTSSGLRASSPSPSSASAKLLAKNDWKEMAKPSLSPADTAEVMSTIGVNFNGFCVAGFTSSDVDKFQSISAMPEFRKFSNEELRLVDLAQKQTNSLVAK